MSQGLKEYEVVYILPGNPSVKWVRIPHFIRLIGTDDSYIFVHYASGDPVKVSLTIDDIKRSYIPRKLPQPSRIEPHQAVWMDKAGAIWLADFDNPLSQNRTHLAISIEKCLPVSRCVRIRL